MNFHRSNTPEKRNKVMSPEQFNQVVQAITDGRYSWACVLILRFAGYNPVYFIPYRTYSRLVKENRLLNAIAEPPTNSTKPSKELSPDQELAVGKSGDRMSSNHLVSVHELRDLEIIDFQENELLGGNLPQWIETSPHYNLFDWRYFKKSLFN